MKVFLHKHCHKAVPPSLSQTFPACLLHHPKIQWVSLSDIFLCRISIQCNIFLLLCCFPFLHSFQQEYILTQVAVKGLPFFFPFQLSQSNTTDTQQIYVLMVLLWKVLYLLHVRCIYLKPFKVDIVRGPAARVCHFFIPGQLGPPVFHIRWQQQETEGHNLKNRI